ncbi:Cdc37 N terminal kinase binding-domain-containing protein [Armillaria novae-zelandiae]|uniref:Hsp90 chaperone protein kinase-targeting subunit n=1 Tax=Armillaria novae-zelandiae TaxID=153914 RepID=A0AA39PPN4_9AGAR|nr:Cdc37 N terminal kinase binding-domain-containing protein [Armillaria novae-zelandiae]
MPLNYSKWDQLELSDDSDIEGHPNVDKKSLIRWKQRDIHEKREKRKHQIAFLQSQIAVNKVLLPRIEKIHVELISSSTSSPSAYFNALVERLEKNPSNEGPPGADTSKSDMTYDGMILSLLNQVADEAKNALKDSSIVESEKEDKLVKGLSDGVLRHIKGLKERIKKEEKELETEEKEQKKHITMDDLHDGFETHYVPPKPVPTSVPTTKIGNSNKTTTTTEFETLNPQASTSAPTPPTDDPEDPEEEGESVPDMTLSLEEFSKLPLFAYERSFRFIQDHPDVIVEGASDALLVAAFRAQNGANPKYAKQCVHQSLLLQYCEKLGKDGVRVFFKKMISGDKRAENVFVEDVEKTYALLKHRVKVSNEEEAAVGGREQIQLVPESGDQSISFNVPDGPPPEELVYEGPDAESIDIEEVRKALQLRWDVFQSFPSKLQDALKENSLNRVNKVLGDMEIPEAEAVVQQLDIAGILNFADGGSIRDETGKSGPTTADLTE